MNANNLLFIGLCVISAAQAATTINSPRGQFSFPGGLTACTVVDMTLAGKLLAMPVRAWRTIRPNQLSNLVAQGVKRYQQALARLHKPRGLFFQAVEAAPAFPELSHLTDVDVFAAAPRVKAPGIKTATRRTLVHALQEVGPYFCGIWTQNDSSQLICRKENTWLFFDSHTKSNGMLGSYLRIFDNDREFQRFINTNDIFEIGGGYYGQANVTLFTLRVPSTKRIQQLTQQLVQRQKSRAGMNRAVKQATSELKQAQKNLAHRGLNKQARKKYTTQRARATKVLARAATLDKQINGQRALLTAYLTSARQTATNRATDRRNLENALRGVHLDADDQRRLATAIAAHNQAQALVKLLQNSIKTTTKKAPKK